MSKQQVVKRFRIRKYWDDVEGQIGGAYGNLTNCVKIVRKNPEYKVYDVTTKRVVFQIKAPGAPESKEVKSETEDRIVNNVVERVVKKETPTPQDVSPDKKELSLFQRIKNKFKK